MKGSAEKGDAAVGERGLVDLDIEGELEGKEGVEAESEMPEKGAWVDGTKGLDIG